MAPLVVPCAECPTERSVGSTPGARYTGSVFSMGMISNDRLLGSALGWTISREWPPRLAKGLSPQTPCGKCGGFDNREPWRKMAEADYQDETQSFKSCWLLRLPLGATPGQTYACNEFSELKNQNGVSHQASTSCTPFKLSVTRTSRFE